MSRQVARDVRALVLVLLVAACGGEVSPSAGTPGTGGIPSTSGTPATGPAGRIGVVATTTVLGDLVAQVGGERVAVTSLVPKGGEVHTFDPTPSDIGRVAAARLVLMNGVGLEPWARRLAQDAGVDPARIVALGEDLEGVTYLEGGEEHEGEAEPHEEETDAHAGEEPHEGEEDRYNPHLWLDVRYAQKYVDRIADALSAVDAANATAYRAAADAYRERLGRLDTEIREALAPIPAAHRRVVSFHEAFPYFAAAYGLEIVGVVVDAPGQEPNAGEIAALIREIRAKEVRAILAEVQFPIDLAQTIADETGVKVVRDLYNDSLGDPPVDSYEGLMRWNLQRVLEALG